MTVDIIAQAKGVLAGSFLARAVYGGEYIDPVYNLAGDGDAERNDDYRGYLASQGPGMWQLLSAADLPTFNDRGGKSVFTAGGLYDAEVNFGPENTFDAQGLLAVQGDTLVLSFRGTDREDPVVEDGQTFVAASLAAHYKAFRSLIDAAYDYAASHPEIDKVVVSGHSLGGAMVDVFALVDAARFRALLPGGLTMVSLASSGIPPELPEYLNGIDPAAAVIVEKVIKILGIPVTIDVIDSLIPPADYISISNAEDRAHFPNDYPDIPEALGLAPIATLKDNLHFGADTIFHNPNIDNTDVSYLDPLDHPLDFRGMGAEHSSALLWANLQGLLSDPLNHHYNNQKLIFGITDYNNLPDWDGSPIRLFEGYVDLDTPGNDADRGARSLIGSSVTDYILGLTGNDRLEGRGGRDLLSGGDGKDVLLGGGGGDWLAGGAGRDVLTGGRSADRFVFTQLDHSGIGGARDVITDFSPADRDRIDVSGIDASAAAAGDQALTFIGTSSFWQEGQIRAVQTDGGTLLRFNTAGTGGMEMEVFLKDVLASSLSPGDFIL